MEAYHGVLWMHLGLGECRNRGVSIQPEPPLTGSDSPESYRIDSLKGSLGSCFKGDSSGKKEERLYQPDLQRSGHSPQNVALSADRRRQDKGKVHNEVHQVCPYAGKCRKHRVFPKTEPFITCSKSARSYRRDSLKGSSEG